MGASSSEQKYRHSAWGTRVLGVLGGMGPAATADFYTKLIKATPANSDQHHIPIVIIGDPRIADRTQAIERGTGADVLAGLLRGLQRLQDVNVDAIAMPCNTAHLWLPSLRAETRIPFISLVEAAVFEARWRNPKGSEALVLGTRATVKAGIYDSELERAGFSAVIPTDEQQHTISTVISLVKAGQLDAAEKMFEEGQCSWLDMADVVLLACTELPIAASRSLATQHRLIDTTAALVNACVVWARPVHDHERDQHLGEHIENCRDAS